MSLKVFKIILIGCLSATTVVLANDSCTIDRNQMGTCLPLYQCESALELFRRIQNGELQLIEQLQKQQCNINNPNPHVCCPLSGLEILQQTHCGDPSGDRIAHGNLTSPGEFPWMALLGFQVAYGEIQFLCGASLITKRYVLTAAHCTKDKEDKLKVVRLGEHDLTKPSDCYTKAGIHICNTHRDYNIQKVISHPSYNNPIRHNDIALLRLTEDVQMNGYISPICLPHTDISQNLRFYQNFLISGWGRTETGYRSNVLLKAEIAYKPIEDCQKTFRREILNENMLCANSDLKSDTCSGDSGGPLFRSQLFHTGVVRYIQYGIVSQGLRTCGMHAMGGVFTNVISYMPWIVENIK